MGENRVLNRLWRNAIRRKTVRALVALVAVTASVMSATPAQANNTMAHVMPSRNITIRLVDLTARFDSATIWAAVNQIDPTDMYTIIYRDNSSRMLNVYDGSYGNTGWHGQWYCNSMRNEFGGSYCDLGTVQFNLSGAPGGSFDDTEARSLACEEIGHAIGLAHNFSSTTTCMSQDWNDTAYDSHDISHINSWY